MPNTLSEEATKAQKQLPGTAGAQYQRRVKYFSIDRLRTLSLSHWHGGLSQSFSQNRNREEGARGGKGITLPVTLNHPDSIRKRLWMLHDYRAIVNECVRLAVERKDAERAPPIALFRKCWQNKCGVLLAASSGFATVRSGPMLVSWSRSWLCLFLCSGCSHTT
jgi:hypothetical protein